eukprot:CAMPEP_0113958578 /NCGR_PEP_ID=MMETSP0011_2-20120614/3538_1 /TAXON_ID=101924 /ORGANISM="Rhodosorus marinus" /LENGTH=308 /DNA_ID=CAMNT_0000969537 /DNA_START=551 /DNA_END=1477 /DNA_ORIENTATION=- /assembly_acc=CAM_ASM_000156
MEAIAGYSPSSSDSTDSGGASSLSDFETGPPAPPPPEALIMDKTGTHNKALVNEERFFVRERIPTLIFIRLPDSFVDHANKVLREVFPSFDITDIHRLGDDTPLHVSLSRRLRVQHEDARQLLSELTTNLKGSGEVRCSLFSVRGFKNEGDRRSFVGLPVHGGVTHLVWKRIPNQKQILLVDFQTLTANDVRVIAGAGQNRKFSPYEAEVQTVSQAPTTSRFDCLAGRARTLRKAESAKPSSRSGGPRSARTSSCCCRTSNWKYIPHNTTQLKTMVQNPLSIQGSGEKQWFDNSIDSSTDPAANEPQV